MDFFFQVKFATSLLASLAGDKCVSLNYLFLWRARSNTSSVILEQMLGTILDTSCSISVFSFWIFLPTILDGVVALHRRTFLLADAVIVKVATSLK